MAKSYITFHYNTVLLIVFTCVQLLVFWMTSLILLCNLRAVCYAL